MPNELYMCVYTCENTFEYFAHNMVRVKLSLCVMHPRGGERLYHQHDIPFSGTPLQYGPVQFLPGCIRSRKFYRHRCGWWQDGELWDFEELVLTASYSLEDYLFTARENRTEYKSTRRFRVEIPHGHCGKHNWTFIQDFPMDRQIKTGVESTLFT